jgi:hypothetical protein
MVRFRLPVVVTSGGHVIMATAITVSPLETKTNPSQGNELGFYTGEV